MHKYIFKYRTNNSDPQWGHSFHFPPVENDDVHICDNNEATYGNSTTKRVTDFLQNKKKPIDIDMVIIENNHNY